MSVHKSFTPHQNVVFGPAAPPLQAQKKAATLADGGLLA